MQPRSPSTSRRILAGAAACAVIGAHVLVAAHAATASATAAPAGAAILGSPPAPTLASSSLTVEPPVPRAAGTPCEVTLFTNTRDLDFSYPGPPPACPRPWSKVVLKVDLSGHRSSRTANFTVSLHNDARNMDWILFRGAPQVNDQAPVWRVERDLTDYASLLTAPASGMLDYVWDGSVYPEGPGDLDTLLSAKLVFYPATARTPAPRIPDTVRPVDRAQVLPRNIVRAYVDVIAQGSRFWYSCVPAASVAAWPALHGPYGIGDFFDGVFSINRVGCSGSSFREVEVRIDGQRAGLAPVFPWLPSDINLQRRNTVDYPAPSVQALNFMPYRVDLTPFAARLNDGAPHTVSLVGVGGSFIPPGFSPAIEGKLLLYLDRGRAVVPGAVTRNTLAPLPATPSVSNTLARTGDIVQGTVTTRLQREFVIQGYVDTSRGRIYSTVAQTSRFANRQDLRVDGLTYPAWHGYRQNIALQSTVGRVSRRVLGGTLLSEERLGVSYPLLLAYDATGEVFETDEGDRSSVLGARAAVQQGRHVDDRQYRRGHPGYASVLHDHFAGHYADAGAGFDADSTRAYSFTDNRGSCYRKKLATLDRVLTSLSTGAGCPDGVNRVRWFARPDGSPASVGWLPSLP